MRAQPIMVSNTPVSFASRNSLFSKYVEKIHINGTVKPFLEKQTPVYTEARKAAQKLETVQSEFLSYQPKIQYDISDFKEVRRLHLGELYANKTEFDELCDRTESWWALNVAQTASDIKKTKLFEVPSFIKEPYNAYCKMVRDINNGLRNLTLNKGFPDIMGKFIEAKDIEQKIDFVLRYYDTVQENAEQIDKLLDAETEDRNLISNLLTGIYIAIKKHKEVLPALKHLIDSANAEALSGEDIERLKTLPHRIQRTISHNAVKFNKEVEEFKLSDNNEKKLKNIISSQRIANQVLVNELNIQRKQRFGQ